ncbi:MAG: mandelate racemase/muconate lactonizing enzyme family protein [Chloroflexota bacterium]|nr:mandelate racemase/muconate lactonizing enzyme family protein [Chloroflexota bacterium]
MPVKEVLACTAVVPLEAQTSFATRTVSDRHYTLVKVRDEQGLEGIGFCYGGSRAGHLSTLAVRDLLRHIVVGREPQETEAIWDTMFRESVLQGRRGSVMRAISAIDIALWDLAAKQAGLPLYRLLGAYHKETVPAYASGGYYLPGKGIEGLVEEVTGWVRDGFPAVKIKVGRLPPEEDALRIKACREAIGPNVQLFLDANNAWADAPSAIRAVRMWEQYDIGWIEEPVMPDDIEASAAVAAAVRTPVATGEIEATRWGFQELISHKAASILQADAAVCGGITEWRRIAALAAGHSIPIAPHWFADLHVHLVASTPNAIWVEFFTDTKVLNFMRLLKRSVQAVKGRLLLPKEPGLGIELDEAVVARYSLDGWK